MLAAKEHEIQDLLRSHNKAISAKGRENRRLRVQLEQTTHRINEKEQTIEELEGQLKQMRLGVPSKNQAQLTTEGSSQKYADITDMKLTWRKGKPAPLRMSKASCGNAAVDKTLMYFNDGRYHNIYCYNTISDVWTRLPDSPNRCSSYVIIDNILTAIGGISIHDQYSNNVSPVTMYC